MISKVILVDQYGNLLELADPSGLTTPVVGYAGTNPLWIEAPSGGGGGGLTFVPEEPAELLNTTTAATIGATLLASGAPDGAVAVVVELWINADSINSGNLIQVNHGFSSTARAVVCRMAPAASFITHAQAIVGLNASEQFYYQVNRAAGTIAYRIYRVGHWI